MLRSLFICLVVLFPLAAFSADYGVVRTTVFDSAAYITNIDPILDSLGHLQGCIYAWYHPFGGGTWVDLVSEEDFIRIPTDYTPIETINYYKGDSLIVYIATDAEITGNTSLILYRAAMADGQVRLDSVIISLDRPDDFDASRTRQHFLSFSRFPDRTIQGVIVGNEFEYIDYELGAWETITYRYSSTFVIDPDLSLVDRSTTYTDLVSGRFNSSPTPQFVGHTSWYYDLASPIMPDHSSGSSVSLLQADSAIVPIKPLPYGAHWLAAYDLFADSPYDELLYYGHNTGLDGAHAPAVDYLACYNLSSGTADEQWYLPISGIKPDHLFGRGYRLMAWRGDSTLLFIDLANGSIADSAVFPFAPTARTTFVVSDDLPLHAAVVRADSVIFVQFDALVDVPDGDQPSLPVAFTLSQNYPNPFNATTEINFSLARTGEVRLTVYNLLGQEVKTLVSGRISAGEHRVTWDGSDNNGSICATGIYLYRLETSESIANRKMLLLK